MFVLRKCKIVYYVPKMYLYWEIMEYTQHNEHYHSQKTIQCKCDKRYSWPLALCQWKSSLKYEKCIIDHLDDALYKHRRDKVYLIFDFATLFQSVYSASIFSYWDNNNFNIVIIALISLAMVVMTFEIVMKKLPFSLQRLCEFCSFLCTSSIINFELFVFHFKWLFISVFFCLDEHNKYSTFS